ncbi:MAG: DUF2007 domain-containing protein [Verrucomicrobiota bacterium]|nr:DUF2007 domain-containing protein [Verrucomicrobiota bacterium]
MQEVFRHWDTATVGLVNSLLVDAGIRTVLRNWDGCNITEIPIPAIYPNVCIMHEEDLARARELISAFLSSVESNDGEWICPSCGEAVDAPLNECWNCGNPHAIDSDAET